MIASVQKAAKLLTIISDGKTKPLTLAELSEKSGINKSTCSHIISTLAKEGFVKRISHTKGYVLGPEIYCLSRFGKYDDELVVLCHPILNWLQKKTGYAIILAVVEAGKKFTIDHIDTPERILPCSYEIMPDDIYRTATGRIIMANMNLSELKEVFEKNGLPPQNHWDGITSFKSLSQELLKIDKKSVIKASDKNNSGMTGYATAIYKNSKCVGAIGIAVQSHETESDDFSAKEQDIRKYLLAARTEIGRRLKYS